MTFWKPHCFSSSLQRWILQRAAAVARHHDIANPMPQLKQRLKENVILMVVRDQDVIDHFRKIVVGVARNVALIRVAEHRIEQHADILGLKQNAGVPEIAPACAFAFVFLRRAAASRASERSETRCASSHSDSVLRGRDRTKPAAVFIRKRAVDLFARKRNLQLDRVALIQSRRAQHKGPVVARDFRKHQALQRIVIRRALVEKRLDQPEGRMIIQIIDQLDIALKASSGTSA